MELIDELLKLIEILNEANIPYAGRHRDLDDIETLRGENSDEANA
jgi:hypothetical protein